MNTYRNRIEELRTELIRAITKLLSDNGLNELKLSYKHSCHIHVIWFDGNDNPYECVVRKVIRNDDGITVAATYDEDEGEDGGEVTKEVVMDSRYELGARNLDWLCDICDNMLVTIREMTETTIK